MTRTTENNGDRETVLTETGNLATETADRRAVTRFIRKIAGKNKHLLLSVVLLGVVVAFTELLMIGLVIPFAATLAGDAGGGIDGPAAFLVPYFSSLPIASRLRLLAVCLLGAVVAQGAARFSSDYLSHKVRLRVDHDVRALAYDKFWKLDLSTTEARPQGEFFTLMHTVPVNVAQLFLSGLRSIPTFVLIGANVTMLLLIAPHAVVVGGALALVTGFVLRVLAKMMHTHAGRANRASYGLNQSTHDFLDGSRTIRTFDRQPEVRARFVEGVEKMHRHLLAMGRVESMTAPLYQIFGITILAALLIAASFTGAADNTAAATALMTSLFIMLRLLNPASQLGNLRNTISSNLAPTAAMVAYLELPERKGLGADEAPPFSRQLELDEVGFAYADDQPEVLMGIDMTITAGTFVAFVGPSGSGKSTTASLLMGIRSPTRGAIRIDGKDLRSLDPKTWRAQMGVVSQDTFLFHGTIAENIRFGNPDATEDDIVKACRIANAHDFITAMPNGYESIVGQRGCKLSGGQIQRVAIARALVRDPRILILDEATSSLDTESERSVQKAIENAARDRTVIAIAHRLSTIQQADVIHVFEGGNVIESGDHETLAVHGGPYARLLESQAPGGLVSRVVATTDAANG